MGMSEFAQPAEVQPKGQDYESFALQKCLSFLINVIGTPLFPNRSRLTYQEFRPRPEDIKLRLSVCGTASAMNPYTYITSL
jgi:hypothetical protein